MIIIDTIENYVYKKEVDWSLLQEGLTLPIDNQVIFGQNMGKFLKRGESKEITLYLNDKSYKARINNVNFNVKHNRKKDTLQIRYPRNGELSKILKIYFSQSYNYILAQRKMRTSDDRAMIRLPEDCKEYLVIYTTEYEDSYVLDTIVANDIYELKAAVKGQEEKVMEASFNYDISDNKSTIFEADKIIKLRKLNKKIGDNLKLLYDYRCQICGEHIGNKYDSNVVEAHHIDYFVKSLNNDSSNQLIVCPNHHSIIHDVNPSFDRRKLIYVYSNGYREGLVINKHL